jgi:LuxR family transcriptional regulator, quorum-sensing system regulator SolR
MLPITHSTGELETLSRIVNEIKPSSASIDHLDEFATRVNEVIPFDRCVIVHERLGRATSRGIVYLGQSVERPHGKRSVQSACGPAIGIDQYLSRFAMSDRLDHAFQWKDAGGTAPEDKPHIAELAAHMAGAQGVAASVRSEVPGGTEVSTLLQFECADVSARLMLLLSFIAFYLHSTFTVHAVEPAVPESLADINLTGKERDVIRWVVEGKTSWEIGRILSTSERTVKFHLKNVYTKLNVCNRAQAVAVANRLRLI